MAEQFGRVKNYPYTLSILKEFEESLSSERMATYLKAARGDREMAARLYTWNTAVSGAFYGTLQGLEVALRNAMNRQLARRYGPAWYDNEEIGLADGCLGRIADAKSRILRDGHTINPPRMVSTLPFGFWVSLLGPGGYIKASRKRANYEMKLWRPALRRTFSHRKTLTRRNAHKPLNELRMLRNRIAHHEPIFGQRLRANHQRILQVTGWISPVTQVWIEYHSRIPTLLQVPINESDVRF